MRLLKIIMKAIHLFKIVYYSMLIYLILCSNSVDIVQILIRHAIENDHLKEILIDELNKLYIEEGDLKIENEQGELDTNNNGATTNKIYKVFLNELIQSKFYNQELSELLPTLKRTLITYHMSSYKHGEIKETNMLLRLKRRQLQVENPDRLSVLLQPPFGVLLSDFFSERFTFRESTQPATLADILRVHDYDYILSIKKICDEFKSMNKGSIYKYDSDTYINQHTWESSIYAAGCVIEAVDSVMSGEFSSAQCLVRPPGHHAGYFGKVE
jgi:hypothetical protein